MGDPAGHALLHHHGGLVSAGDIVPLGDSATQAGIRLIAFDHSGISGSSLAVGRRVQDGGDAEQLLDHLGIAEARVMGWSMGGPYALAHEHAELLPAAAAAAGTVQHDGVVEECLAWARPWGSA